MMNKLHLGFLPCGITACKCLRGFTQLWVRVHNLCRDLSLKMRKTLKAGSVNVFREGPENKYSQLCGPVSVTVTQLHRCVSGTAGNATDVVSTAAF